MACCSVRYARVMRGAANLRATIRVHTVKTTFLAWSLLIGVAVEIHTRRWYVVYSKARKEQQAQFHLARKGIESFFPRLYLPASVHGVPKLVPMFPNYLFVKLDIALEFSYVAWSPGVKRFVSFSDVPLALEDNVVTFLKENANTAGVITARSQLLRGQAVEISTGPFSGLAAIIQDPPDAKGRVRVLLKLMSRQVTVRLGVEAVDGGRADYALADRAKIDLPTPFSL